MRALVAGGSGFIGSHLCERLLERGYEVVCLDNLATGHATNVAHLLERPGFRVVHADVSQGTPELDRLDIVFHLASPANPHGYLDIPVQTALANSLGTYNLLELARKHGASFLLASTSEVYGDPEVHPQSEEYWGHVNPIGLRSCYDESKRFAESLSFVYLRQHGLDIRVVRIFNCYGPHCDPADGRVVPRFISLALRGEPITVYGTGTQTRSYCYVTDLVEGILRTALYAQAAGQVINVGNPDERTIIDLATVVNDLCGRRSEIVFRPPISTDDPQRRCPDIGRARALLGWEPTVGLVDGLRHTIDWMRSRVGLEQG